MHDNTSNEDAFNTDVTVDYAPVLTALQNTCGRSETEAIGRITVGTGFSAISGTVSTLSLDALYATNTPNHPAQTPHNITTTTSIDMTDCGDAIALANAIQYTISADNITTQTNSCAPITYVPKRNDDISIGDFVWDDLNRDGRQNAGEP